MKFKILLTCLLFCSFFISLKNFGQCVTVPSFGAGAVVESFEGMPTSPTNPSAGGGYTVPVMPFTFSSGVILTAPAPNSNRAYLGDWSKGGAGWGLCPGNVTAADVPAGTAYFGLNSTTDALGFTLPILASKVGFYVEGASTCTPQPITLTVYNASNVVIGTCTTAPTGSATNWKTHFIGFNSASVNISRITISGSFVVIDKLTFEAGGISWQGGTSNNWFTPANWSSGTVPTSTDDVTIPTGTPNPCVIGGGTADVHDLTINAGATLTNNGTLNLNGGGVVTTAGTYKGSGTFTGANYNNSGGTVSPGNSPGCTVFGAGYTNGSGTELIEIAGTTPCTQHDQLQVTGTATLSGTLNVVFFGGFTPSCGQTYKIMTSTTLVGTFATVNFPAMPLGLTMNILYNAPNPGDVTLTVTGNPVATATPAAQTICSGSAITPIVLTSTVASTTYTWTRNNTVNVTGIPASGSGNISGTLFNTTNVPQTVTFTITPTSGTCVGPTTTATVTVNPIPTVNAVASQVKCNGQPSNAVAFSGNVAGTVYNWTNSDPSIGLAASGSGNIAPFTVTNATTDPVAATITVTPSYTNAGVTCTGASTSFTITVNPTATVDPVTSQILCANTLTTAINFSSPSSGFPASTIVYNWTNTNTGIGLLGSGNGNIPAFTATNNTTAPIIANITVTPTYTYNGVSCTGSPTTFSITVNPRATVNGIANQSLCNGNATAAVNFSSAYTGGSIVYNWVNNDPSIGLAASGAGNIASFTATNPGTAPVTATITVTPTYTSNAVSCVGTSSTFTITVNPTASVDPVSDETLCANQVTTPIVFTSPVSGTIYNWVNNNPSIGLAASGTGNIPSFTTANNLTNATSAVITVRPTTPGGCIGAAINFTITVNPIATVNAVANQVLCNGASTAAINFSSPTTGGTVTYNWTNSAPSIGIAASGSGNIPGFVATNITISPVVATITVTPTFTNNAVSCTGTPRTFTITVNPTATVNTVTNQDLCNGDATTAINFTSPTSGGGGSNIVFNWVNNTTSIGLAASGSGNIASFVASNNTLTPVTATITVTPTYTNGGVSCAGTPLSFTIMVLPTVTVNPVANQVFCNGLPTPVINFTSPNSGGTINYSWDNSDPSIGLAAFGSGNLPSFTATNTTSSPVTAIITVRAQILNPTETISCNGTPRSFTITVNPTASVNPVANQILCTNATTTAVNFSGPVAGTTVTWVNNNPSIGLAASGSGNIPSFATVNTTNSPQVATITVTATAPNACAGTPTTFTITVNPVAIVTTVANQVLCAGSLTSAVAFSSPTSGSTVSYTWTNNTASIGLATSGIGNIAAFTATNAGTSPVTATVIVTPQYGVSEFYCTNNNGNALIKVNALTGAVTTIGNFGFGGTYALAFKPDGTAWTLLNGLGNAQLASVNLITGAATPVGSPFGFPALGLDANSAGQLYTVGYTNANLYTINSSTGVTTFVASTGGYTSVMDIAFDASNTLWSISSNGRVNSINTTTGAVTVGPVMSGGISLGSEMGLMISNNGTMYLTEYTGSPRLFTVNPLTGVTTLISSLAANFPHGGDFPPGGGTVCTGNPTTFTITVNPTATINAVANQTLCNGAATSAVNFTTTNSGGTVTYSWTNNTTSIGLPANGTGNIAPFTAVNTSTSPVVATITVTPTFTNSGVSCTGTPITFTYTVNPTATVNTVTNQVVCNGAATTAVNFTSPATGGAVTYDWTNTNATIGLAASGTGNIASFTAVNNGTAPVTATVTVTPTFTNGGVSCTGTPRTFTITVNPTANVNAVSNQTLCNGASTTAVNFTTNATGGSVTYNWVNNTPSIGLAASGTGNIPSFTATNAGTTAVTATITVTPVFNNGGVNCNGTAMTFTITVNPSASVNAVANQVLCANVVTSPIVFSSPVAGTTYSWVNNNTAIGLGASGNGNIPSFTTSNTTNNPLVATITVTPSAPTSCGGAPITFTITINPVAIVTAVTSQVLCAGSLTNAVNFSSPATGGTVTYAWTNNNTSIGLAASGSGNIAAFTATNAGVSPVTATITVTPTYTNGAVSCVGTPTTFTITVNPASGVTVNPVPNQVLCNGTSTTAVNFSSTATGGTVTYNWTNNNTTIGLGASGTGNIAAFAVTNTGTSPVVATVTVTPTFSNGGAACTGTPTTFTITVNPTATVNAVGNVVVCNNSTVAAINFSSPSGGAVTYAWTNSNTSIGLAASGTGNIAAFTGVNTGTSPVTSTVTVTPTFTNGSVSCTGTPTTFTITINPTATVNTVANQVLCNGVSTANVIFSSPNSGGSIVYNWINNTPSIGLAASGSGNIFSFTAVNTGTTPVTATITVTPTITNAGVSCVGTPLSFTITVNPTATVNAVANQVFCGNTASTAITFSGAVAGTTFSWINNNTAIGLAASGLGNIPSFTTANDFINPTTATITVTPISPAGCVGSPVSFTITILPVATVNTVANQVLCNGSSTNAINFSSPAVGGTVTYNWVNNTPSIGIAASGTGNIPSFTAVNTGLGPVTATITVTPTYTNGATSCVGVARTFTITVNPTAVVNAVANQVLCNTASTAAITFTSPNTIGGGSNIVFNWANNTPSIGLAASGTGTINSFTAVNNTTAPVTATIIVTPTYTNAGVSCTGTTITFTLTVNPTATANVVANQSLCNNTPTAAVNFSSIYTGGTVVYNWVNNTPSIGLAASGAGNIASFIATNTTNNPVTATISITPTFTNAGVSCVGTSSTFTITVNPTGNVNAISNQIHCANATTLPIVFTSGVAGTSYSWVNNNPAIGLAATGVGNIPSFVTANNLTNAITATITVTPTSPNGCAGLPITFTITVNPVATVNTVANQVLCNGSSTAAIAFSSPATGGSVIFTWANSAPSIGLGANGAGNIPTFIATNSTTAPVVATITVTPTFINGGVSCVGTSSTFTITVNPTATANAVANQVLCNASSSTPITFTSPNSGNGGSNVVFNWANNTPSIGLAASGAGNIASFIATNTTTAPVVATITVTPTYTNGGVSCVGTPMTFNITVNPTATANPVANQSLCNGVATAAVNFSTTYTGGAVVYNWVNNTPSIGLAAAGSGNIASFIATNTTTVQVTATITVTPTFTNGGVSCVGTSSTFTITVNPPAVVNPVANQSLCANTTTSPIVFSSPVSGTTYTWVNNNTAIGLAATGVGNIPSFVTVNTLNSINATITVTPNSPFGCTGLPITFVITVNPIVTVNVVPNQILCNGRLTDSIKFSSPNGTNGGGNIVYNWTNSAPSIGIPATGTGTILPFTATNTGAVPVIALITVTPSFVNGTSNCVGIPITFSITVNPTAVVNAIANQTVCAGQLTTAVSFTGPVAGTVYNWVNSNPAIGLAASGTGNIPSFIAQNPTFSTITGTITVTPNTSFGCVGSSRSFDIIVPALSVAPTAISTPALVLCDTNTVTTLRVVGGGLGTGANWVWYRDACGGTPIGTGAVLNNVIVGNTTTFYVRAEGTCNITTCASVRIQVAKLVTHVRQHWNDVLFFDNSSNNYVKWQWYKNGALIPGATQQHYTENGGLNGTYYVVATDKNGIELLTCPLDIAPGGFTGIELKISPNPVQQGQTYRLISNLTPAQLQGAAITVRDIIGTLVSQTNTASTVTTLQAPNTTGMYIVTLLLRNGQKYSVTMIVR